MSLENQFPEIISFFKKDKFTQLSLNELQEKIKVDYKDKSIYKSAITLIELKLLKYKLQDDIKQVDKDKLDQNNVTKKTKSLNSSKIKTVNNLCYKFGLDKEIFLLVLKEKGIHKKLDDIFTTEELKIVNPLIASRYEDIRRKRGKKKNSSKQKVKRKSIKKKTKSGDRIETRKKKEKKESSIGSEWTRHRYSGSTSGVWSDVSKYGLGKIIYIRSK